MQIIKKKNRMNGSQSPLISVSVKSPKKRGGVGCRINSIERKIGRWRMRRADTKIKSYERKPESSLNSKRRKCTRHYHSTILNIPGSLETRFPSHLSHD